MTSAAHITILGQTPSAGTTANPIWGVGGSTSYVQLLVATPLEIVSSSANDAAAGTGARTVRVNGVELIAGVYSNFSEVLTLNGVTPVPLVHTSAVAINSSEIVTAGSGATNAGNIDVRAVTGSLIKSRIASNAEAVGKSQDFIFTIPTGYYGLLRKIQVYASGLTGSMLVYLKTFNKTGVGMVRCLGQDSLSNTGFASGHIEMTFGDGLYIAPETLMVLIVDLTAGSAIVSALGDLEYHSGAGS